MEMVLKIIAKGFVINKYSYLRNRWNMLDFIVVLSGLVTTCIGEDNKEAGNLEVLRTFRVLRAVKTISILPGNKYHMKHNIDNCRLNACLSFYFHSQTDSGIVAPEPFLSISLLNATL